MRVSKEEGFVELLIVLIIIAVLLVIAIPIYTKFINNANKTMVKTGTTDSTLNTTGSTIIKCANSNISKFSTDMDQLKLYLERE